MFNMQTPSPLLTALLHLCPPPNPVQLSTGLLIFGIRSIYRSSFINYGAIPHPSKPSVRNLPVFARLFISNYKPLYKTFSLCVLPYLINIAIALQPQLALCGLSRNWRWGTNFALKRTSVTLEMPYGRTQHLQTCDSYAQLLEMYTAIVRLEVLATMTPFALSHILFLSRCYAPTAFILLRCRSCTR